MTYGKRSNQQSEVRPLRRGHRSAYGSGNLWRYHQDPRRGEPVHVPGGTEKFFADNGAYYTCVTNAGYTGDLEMALIPDSVKVAIFGWEIDKNGALVEIADAVPKPFALLFKVKGDAKDRLNVFYNVTAERPSDENKTTEDSASPTTEKLAVTMIPEEIGGKKVTKLSIEKSEANATAYSGFYDSVLTPSFTEASS